MVVVVVVVVAVAVATVVEDGVACLFLLNNLLSWRLYY
jgi:hypothetical protein